MDLARFIQIYIIQGIVCIYFLILGFKIIKRGRKRLNLILSAAYFTAAIGFIANFIYAPLTEPIIVLALYYVAIYCSFMFPAFILVFVVIIYKSEKMFTRFQQNLVLLTYGILLFCMVFIPNGVTINESTDWIPVWNIYFAIYLLLLTSLFGFIPTLYVGFKATKTFENAELKKKWKYFIIGFIGIYLFGLTIIIANAITIEIVVSICRITGLILVIISPYLVYYGVGKELK